MSLTDVVNGLRKYFGETITVTVKKYGYYFDDDQDIKPYGWHSASRQHSLRMVNIGRFDRVQEERVIPRTDGYKWEPNNWRYERVIPKELTDKINFDLIRPLGDLCISGVDTDGKVVIIPFFESHGEWEKQEYVVVTAIEHKGKNLISPKIKGEILGFRYEL